MAGANSQYLQVPKVSPHRPKSPGPRSRSRPRPSRPEAVISPTKSRPQSPPMPVADGTRKPTLHGFASPPSVAAKEYTNGYTTRHNPVSLPREMEDVKITEPEGTNYDDLNGDLYTLERCMTPPPEIPLRQKLIGSWRLESYMAYPLPESQVQRVTYPMTKNVTGFIMYTPDGYMAAQMLIPGQQSFKRGEGEDAQWSEAAKRFFAYSGPYYINNEGPGREEVLRHTFQSLQPSRVDRAIFRYGRTVSRRTAKYLCLAVRSLLRSRYVSERCCTFHMSCFETGLTIFCNPEKCLLTSLYREINAHPNSNGGDYETNRRAYHLHRHRK